MNERGRESIQRANIIRFPEHVGFISKQSSHVKHSFTCPNAKGNGLVLF